MGRGEGTAHRPRGGLRGRALGRHRRAARARARPLSRARRRAGPGERLGHALARGGAALDGTGRMTGCPVRQPESGALRREPVRRPSGLARRPGPTRGPKTDSEDREKDARLPVDDDRNEWRPAHHPREVENSWEREDTRLGETPPLPLPPSSIRHPKLRPGPGARPLLTPGGATPGSRPSPEPTEACTRRLRHPSLRSRRRGARLRRSALVRRPVLHQPAQIPRDAALTRPDNA